MTNTQKACSNVKNRSDSMASGSSTETIGAVDSQETEELAIGIEPRMRSYIDSAIQTATVSIMQQMQQFITQQAETQHEWNAQLLETINQKLAHIDRPSINENDQNPINVLEDNQQRIPNSKTSSESAQGNYPPTPIINSLLLASGTKDKGTEPAEKSEIVSYITTSRKYLSFVYTFKDNTYVIQGFLNEKTIETNLPNKIWKTIALGLFADLQEFAQRNLINNVKTMREDTVLQASEG
ncbi:34835_t:CDS:2, partial [Gigaspora margarita]